MNQPPSLPGSAERSFVPIVYGLIGLLVLSGSPLLCMALLIIGIISENARSPAPPRRPIHASWQTPLPPHIQERLDRDPHDLYPFGY